MVGVTTERGRIVKVIEQYGKCLELVSMDPNFHDISVGLYIKGRVATVWTFSQAAGVEDRIRQIRDQVVELGGFVPVNGTHNQVSPTCGQFHLRPIKFLMMQAVEKPPDFSAGEGRIEVKDLRSPMTLIAEAAEEDGKWVYRVSGEGEYKNPAARLRAVTGGFVRYGDMELVEDGVVFPCGARHDQLVRLILPYARNVSGVQDMLDASAMRGQMTTGTLGFSQT
jgi:hypothetical protein